MNHLFVALGTEHGGVPVPCVEVVALGTRKRYAIVGFQITDQRQIVAGTGTHEVQKFLVDTNVIH